MARQSPVVAAAHLFTLEHLDLTLVPAGQGIIASVIACFMVSSWIAIGSVFLGRRDVDDELAAPGAILIGSAITSFLLALLTAAGFVTSGVVVVGAGSALITALRWRRVVRQVRSVIAPLRGILSRPSLAIPGVVIAVTLWVAAISPPRSADAMRYHLAHIGQIVTDGRWSPVADYHYALPFGWSLSYLPFELLHLPQGAQLLGLALLVVFVSSVIRALDRIGVGGTAILVSMLLLLHPASLRVFTEASADAIALFVVLAIVLLILRLDDLTSHNAGLLGFAAAIGLQSRYQLGAAALAAVIVVVVSLRSHPAKHGAAFAMAGGAIAALLLVSPFYIANQLAFGNPVWPLFIDVASPAASYADTVAYTYSRSLIGAYKPAAFGESVVTLVTTPFLFPLAILIPAVIVVAALRRNIDARRAGMFGVIFLIEWAVMQPLLYPRFILLMLPVAVVCAGILAGRWVEKHARYVRMTGAFAAMLALALSAAAIYVNQDNYRYAVTGDAARYHQYTWFYRTYEWVNRNTPDDVRFLVIVSSAQSYYLDRQYRRADPWLSGVVDWHSVDDGAKLDSVLARGKYSYLIYENRSWMLYPGGVNTERAVGDAYRKGLLRKVASFDDTLYTSRFRRQYRTTRVHVLERVSATSGP